MPLMPYEPNEPGCAKCGKTMAEHPWIKTDLDKCESFQDPDFVAGVDREEDEPTRSEVHGISTVGYADNVTTPWLGLRNGCNGCHESIRK